MGRLSGLNEGEAMTADVNDDRADAGELLVVLTAAGPEEIEEIDEEIDVIELWPLLETAVAAGPPVDMLKAAGTKVAGEMEVVDVGWGPLKSVEVKAGAPRVAVKSSGEMGG
jgi:hypothetical protein